MVIPTLVGHTDRRRTSFKTVKLLQNKENDFLLSLFPFCEVRSALQLSETQHNFFFHFVNLLMICEIYFVYRHIFLFYVTLAYIVLFCFLHSQKRCRCVMWPCVNPCCTLSCHFYWFQTHKKLHITCHSFSLKCRPNAWWFVTSSDKLIHWINRALPLPLTYDEFTAERGHFTRWMCQCLICIGHTMPSDKLYFVQILFFGKYLIILPRLKCWIMQQTCNSLSPCS